MARFKKWQSGSADLVSVAVGMVILSIAAAGTAASMIYGREILARQERYKTAAHMLRGEMEKKVWELQSFAAAREQAAMAPSPMYTLELTGSGERGNWNQPVAIHFVMDRIEVVPDLVRLDVPAYWIVTMHATWQEPEMAGSRNPYHYQSRSISYRTAVEAPS